jgi:hypothetical protein
MALYDKATMNGQSTAFPTDIDDGLTKREWFAGMALQGLLAHPVNHAVDACVSMSIFAADCILKQLAESDGAK